MGKREEFLKVFRKAEAHYGSSEKRLAGEGWDVPWKTLICTILSAQSRDETTIAIATRLFGKYDSLEKIAGARESDLKKTLKGMNYYKTKAKNIKKTAGLLLTKHEGRVPDNISELIELPGVGRKTANLVITEEFGKDGICVDVHVHRLTNVLGLVNTKNPTETEFALQKISPKKYWSRINRIFVLWGKEVPGRDKKRILAKLEEG